MFRATQKQVEAYEETVQTAVEKEKAKTKDEFIEDFLAFAGKVSYSGGGRSFPLSKGLSLFQLHGRSDHMALPNAGEHPVGAEVTAYRSVVAKDGYWTSQKKQALGETVVGGEVRLGLIVEGTFPRLSGQETVLQVSTMPPLVLYRQEQGVLAPVEPDTDHWDEMTALIDILKKNEAELVSKFKKS